jgi:hypothetical protein
MTAELQDLVTEIEAARRRAIKAEPGERTDIVRYESLCTRLEAVAAARVRSDGVESRTASAGDGIVVTNSGHLSVSLRLPLEPGAAAQRTDAAVGPPPVADAWQAEGNAKGRRAVEQRFRRQLDAALAPSAGKSAAALDPSGVNNRVITEVLRGRLAGSARQRVDVPVVYRDGSAASAPFPLRCLHVRDAESPRADLTLRLALLSIRHTEMDPVVDGAWLRNAEVSRPRPAAQTDDFVHQTSKKQLLALTDDGRRSVRLQIFQTGLETAIIGFYRAVVEHLLEHPRTLEVVPMFYASSTRDASSGITDDEAGFERGAIWAAG